MGRPAIWNARTNLTYRTWQSMRQRCGNPKVRSYKQYGARGIKVCERWNSFANFLADMGQKDKGYSIERIDNNGDYEPKNCKWIPLADQHLNKRTYSELYAKNGSQMSKNTKLTEWLFVLGKLAELDTTGKTKKHVITIDQGRTLFSVMQHEGLNVAEHGRALDLPSSTMSKNMSDLGAGNGRNRKGMGLIELTPSAQNLSHKVAFLTQKGRDLRDQLTKGTGAK